METNILQRPRVADGVIEAAIEHTTEALYLRLGQKGYGAFASSHEILGQIVQETAEFTEAVHKKEPINRKIQELEDIAVAAIFGIASILAYGEVK